MLRKVRAEGRAIIFISHFLDDVLEISDRVTVFRNGRKVTTKSTSALSKPELIHHMIGADADELHAGESAEMKGDDSRPVTLALRGARLGRMLNNFSLDLRAGEITGVYGFMGCGQIELSRALFGKLRLSEGEILIDGAPVRFSSTAAARRAGVALVPENRRMMLFPAAPVYQNVSISILGQIGRILLRPPKECEIAGTHVKDLQIRPPSATIPLGSLSGGNQQKVALAKWLTRLPKALILAEPTRGMDVGAKEDVIRILKDLRDRGVAILVLSTEPETILTLADRVTVMRKGAVSRRFDTGRITKSDLLEAA